MSHVALDAVGYEAGDLRFQLERSVRGESEAKASETADQPVESAARRRTGTKYEAVAQASQVALLLTPAEAKSIRLELDFTDLDRLARSGGHGAALASALRKLDEICDWPACCESEERDAADAIDPQFGCEGRKHA